jgi:hypothetical protein
MLPGGGSFQSVNVRIGIFRRGSGMILRGFVGLANRRAGLSSRSIVAALIASILVRTESLRRRWPSSAGASMGLDQMGVDRQSGKRRVHGDPGI